jgi:hypothetical protein
LGALCSLAKAFPGGGGAAIIAAGGVAPLVQLLYSNSSPARRHAAAALHHLCQAHPVEAEVVAAGGIPALAELLGKAPQSGDSCDAPRAQEHAAAVACSLTRSHKRELVREGVVEPLVELLGCGDLDLQREAAGVACNLASSDESRPAVVKAGGLLKLALLLGSGDDRLKCLAATGLGNMLPRDCSRPDGTHKHCPHLAGGVLALLQLLQLGRQALPAQQAAAEQLQAAAALQQLTAGGPLQTKVQAELVAAGGVPTLLEALAGAAGGGGSARRGLSSDVAKMAGGAAWTLQAVAAGSEGGRIAVARQKAAAPLLVKLLGCSDSSLQTAAAATIGSLAGSAEGFRAARLAGAEQALERLLNSTVAEEAENALGELHAAGGAVRKAARRVGGLFGWYFGLTELLGKASHVIWLLFKAGSVGLGAYTLWAGGAGGGGTGGGRGELAAQLNSTVQAVVRSVWG